MTSRRSGIGSLSGSMNPRPDTSPNFRGSPSIEQDIRAGTGSGLDGCWWISISAEVVTKGGRARRYSHAST
jgi:hypothetical protein